MDLVEEQQGMVGGVVSLFSTSLRFKRCNWERVYVAFGDCWGEVSNSKFVRPSFYAVARHDSNTYPGIFVLGVVVAYARSQVSGSSAVFVKGDMSQSCKRCWFDF